jgi:hypothetical protein
MAILVPKLKIASVHFLKLLKSHACEQKSIFSHIERYRRDMKEILMAKLFSTPRRTFLAPRARSKMNID